jgi:hypothetical protein
MIRTSLLSAKATPLFRIALSRTRAVDRIAQKILMEMGAGLGVMPAA